MAVDQTQLGLGTATFNLTLGAGTGSRTSNVVDLSGYTNLYALWSSYGSGGSNIKLEFSPNGTQDWTVPTQTYDYAQNYAAWSYLGAFSSIGGNTGPNLMTFPAYGRFARLSIASGTTTGTYTLQLTGHNGPLPPSMNIPQKVQGHFNPNDTFTPGSVGMQSHSLPYGFRGLAEGTWDRLRTPTTYKVAFASSSGNTAVWTPASGRKVRLMRYKLSVPGNAYTNQAGSIFATFYDGPSGLVMQENFWLPGSSASVFGGWQSGWIDLGNGILSAAADRVLYMNLSAPVTGNLMVMVCGTEE